MDSFSLVVEADEVILALTCRRNTHRCSCSLEELEYSLITTATLLESSSDWVTIRLESRNKAESKLHKESH